VEGERRTVGLTCHDKTDHWTSFPSRETLLGHQSQRAPRVQSFGARKGVTPMTKLLMKPENPISG
jgi:hypothetical protein